jgi:hypothetical protein
LTDQGRWRVDKNETYIYGIWFVGDGKTGDWMARLVVDDGKWTIKYRFRYYSAESADPFDGKDRKSWYQYAAKDASDKSRDEGIRATDLLFPVMETQYGEKGEFVKLDCPTSDLETMEKKLSGKKWIHMVKIEVDK